MTVGEPEPGKPLDDPPPELPGGQDGPPDLHQFLVVVREILAEARDDVQDRDLALRIGAIRRVADRLVGEVHGDGGVQS